MAERSPLFLGLARPPKYLGLPVGYLVVLAMGVVLPFIWTKSLIFFLIGIIAYPVLWFVADKEPHFFEVRRPHTFELSLDLRFRGFFWFEGVSRWELQASFRQGCHAVQTANGIGHRS